jgi:plastocyanin
MRRLLALSIIAVALTAVACGSDTTTSPSTTSPSAPSTTPDVTITIEANNGAQSFAPNPSAARVGQTVAWQNVDSITHNATQDGGSFQTGNISPGTTSTPIMMSSAGTFTYHCSIHPGMVGTLTVQ